MSDILHDIEEETEVCVICCTNPIHISEYIECCCCCQPVCIPCYIQIMKKNKLCPFCRHEYDTIEYKKENKSHSNYEEVSLNPPYVVRQTLPMPQRQYLSPFVLPEQRARLPGLAIDHFIPFLDGRSLLSPSVSSEQRSYLSDGTEYFIPFFYRRSLL